MRLKNNIRADADADNGAVAVVVAVFTVVAFGFAAIVVDLGYARVVKARAQDAADSAALAAAAELYSGRSASDAATAAETNARNVLGLDGLDEEDWLDLWTDCDDPSRLPVPLPPIPEPSCVSFDVPEADTPRQVRVRVPDTPVDSFFGGIFDYEGIDISAAATASIGPIEFTPACAICVLDPGPHLLNNAQVRTDDGADISFNGDVQLVGTSAVTAVARIVFVRGEGTPPTGFAPEMVKIVDPVINPLNVETLPILSPRTDPCNPDDAIGGPGIYTGTVILTDGCELDPGTYVITGTLTAEEDAEIDGDNGVQFWLPGGSSVDLSDADVVDLDAPEDRSLVYARTGSPSINLFGEVSSTIVGDIDAPVGTIIGGPSSGCTIDGRIVVAELDVDDQCLISTQDTAVSIAPPSPPVLIG